MCTWVEMPMEARRRHWISWSWAAWCVFYELKCVLRLWAISPAPSMYNCGDENMPKKLPSLETKREIYKSPPKDVETGREWKKEGRKKEMEQEKKSYIELTRDLNRWITRNGHNTSRRLQLLGNDLVVHQPRWVQPTCWLLLLILHASCHSLNIRTCIASNDFSFIGNFHECYCL